MRARLWHALLAAACLFAAQAATADPAGHYFYLAPMGGFTVFPGDFNWPGSRPLADKAYIGGRLGYQRGPLWGLELASGVTPTMENVDRGANASFTHASASLVMSPWAGPAGGPYLFVGGGAGRLGATQVTMKSSGEVHLNQGLVEAGGGLRLWLTDNLGLRVEAREAHWLPKKSKNAPRANYLTLSCGLTFAIGAKGRDTDKDGVPDSRDRQSNTLLGAQVDQFGVAIDEDADGVPNGIDRQNNTQKGALVDQYGVAIDSDHDGVPDGIDQCPDTPVGCVVDAKGCTVDSDGDGVCDGLDKCPNSPRGCNVDKDGCPIDTDADGVCDSLDKCPGTPAGTKVDSVGCAVADTIAFERGIVPLRRIYFETGKAVLLPESEVTLKAVGDTLMRYPDLKIEIQGHTDSRGTDEYNQALSTARARAVRTYLLQTFKLKPRNLVAKGYGKSQLEVSPETTDQDYLKNRRVMLKVLNPEVLPSNVKVEEH